MKQVFQFRFWLLMLLMLLGLPLGAWADREVLQPQFGKQTIEVASDEVITFYDFKGSSDISSSSSNNSHSLTVFTPAEAGKSVQITFEEIDIYPDGTNYPAFMNVYSGNPDADDSFTWVTTTGNVTTSTTLPEGDILKTMGGSDKTRYTSTNETFVSGAADGSMAVGFIYKYASTCKGWKATVKVVTLENMTITGAGSNYDGVVASPSSKQNVALANAFVTAEGVMNPDNVTGIYFTMTTNEGVVDPAALKLFKGDKQVEATVASGSAAGNYVFTLNEAPADGTTTFTVKGDILGTAAVGAKVQVDITKIATAANADGITPFTVGTPVTVENPALVLMTSSPQTVTVGETTLQFYDEGGKDGGIVSKTNGQVTFLSGVEGKKVMVNFTNNAIWHGTLYNQELRIYSGREVKAENLIKTLQQGETGLVRSTADDGSLTVVLYSDASNNIAADGWEAEVSLFTPQPMTFDGITTAAASTETVCAGDTDQDILNITVSAINTEPAMQVTKMAFNAGESYALVSGAALYFGTKKVGECSVLEGSAFEITLTTPQALTEGDILFTLKYTISDEALNGQKLSAKAVSVTALVNGAEKTETVTADAAERTVENIVLSQASQGTVTKTVNGSLAFNTKTASSYSSYCEAGTDTRTNIFVPKHEGMVCQIDFSEFNVQYASTSYGNKSTFKIYAGQGTDGTLLWELNDNSQESVGPGEVVRSTAADGALTIVFSPKASYSYNYKGWKATVSEYQSKDMEVVSVEATQATTADASIGATAQELISVNVKTEGNLNALQMSAMKLNLKGTEANLSNISVWQNDTKLGESSVLNGSAIEITFAEAVTLVEGDNLFTVKADISENATEDGTIDASLTSITVGSNAVAATTGDPEGQRTLKNMLLMTEGDHGTMNLGLGKIISVYDDGGAEGDGADGVEATVTFAPTGEADCIKLTDKGISFAYTAYLYIYKGGEVNDDNLLLTLNGSSAKFDPIISDADFEGGKLTIKYVGKGSYTRPNFAMLAEGYKKTPVAITGVTTEDLSVSEVLKGQTDTKMLKVVVTAKGELESVDVTAFNVTGSNGEAVDAMHIYQTGTTTTFSANETFNEKYTITNSGDYYFWITYDVKTDAAVGQTATATLNSIVVDGAEVSVTDPATATITVASGKSGTYIVGEGGTYPTIQAAVDDLGTLGMEGPVVLKIKAGDYNEKVRIPYIKGMGAVNTLTLESESGERDVKIYHNQYTTAGYSDDQHKKDYGVVTLYEASYVTLKNLEIYTTDVSYKAVVMIKDESRHATIDNCYLHAPVTTSGDVCLVGHTIIDEENKNNDYLTVRNSLLEGGKMGISMGGTSYVALPKEVGGVIEGNTIKNSGTKAIYVMDELGVKIRNNNVIIDADAETKVSVGILDMQLRDEYSEATEITGNTFNVAPKSYAAVMNLRQLEGTEDAPVLIANNVINLASLNASYSAFKFNGSKVKNTRVAHNTIRMTGTDGGAAFWAASKLDDGYGNVQVVNNIIQNETSGYAVNLYNDGNLGTDKINFQNNLMYTAGQTFFRAASSTSGDFDTFVEKTGATACVNKQVTFASDDILMPADDLDGDLLTAQALSYVTTDITGKERPEENITIGAYEFSTEDAVPVMAADYPTVSVSATFEGISGTLIVKADAEGSAYVVLKKQDEDAPTADDIVENGQKSTIQADAEASFSFSDLDESTTYVAYIVLQSVRGTNGELITKEFTTSEKPVELMAVCTEPETTIAHGERADLKVMVASGKAPFTVTWIDSRHETVGDPIETDLVGEDIVLTITPERSGDYIVTVKDAQELEASDTCRIIVTGKHLAADFENLYVGEEGYWCGPTKGEGVGTIYGDTEIQGSFISGSYSFANNYTAEYPSWNGFAYTNSTSNVYEGLADQYNAVTSGAHKGNNYAVFFDPMNWSPATVTVLDNADGEVISGFYITNTAWTVDAILHGDGSWNKGETDGKGETVYDDEGNVVGTEEFHEGDYLRLTITADNDDSRTVEFYLADYTSGDSDDWYYVNDWQWVDLSSLGVVKVLKFALEGSRRNLYGPTTPFYFCMDDFGGNRPVELDEAVGFDAADFASAGESTQYDVTLKRHLYNDFNTLTVPFDVTKANMAQLGEGTRVYHFTGYDGEYLYLPELDFSNKADDEVVLHANESYVIASCDETETLQFEGIELNTEGLSPVTYAVGDLSVTMSGNYAPHTFAAGEYGVTAAGHISPVKPGVSFNAFRAYFTLSEEAAAKGVSVFLGNDATPTAIDRINGEWLSADGCYDLQGRKVERTQKGVYIQNGKKIVIK